MPDRYDYATARTLVAGIIDGIEPEFVTPARDASDGHSIRNARLTRVVDDALFALEVDAYGALEHLETALAEIERREQACIELDEAVRRYNSSLATWEDRHRDWLYSINDDDIADRIHPGPRPTPPVGADGIEPSVPLAS